MLLSWRVFSYNLAQDFKLIVFTWIYLNVLRLVSIAGMKSYASDIGVSDIMLALGYGARMSLKTAGILMLFSFVFATLPNFLRGRTDNRLRLYLAAVYFFITNFLFVAGFFYYKEFHTNFNEIMFNALNDDVTALFYTFIQQYHLIEGTIGVAILTFAVIYILRRFLNRTWLQKSLLCGGKWYFRVGVIVFTLVFALFTRFGASFSYAKSIHWENCAKTKDAFLNEMILDNMQAVYRGYSIKKRIDNGIIYGVNKDKIRFYTEKAANESDAAKLGKADLTQIDANLVYQAQGNIIAPKRHIFILIGESFAQWPLLDKYADLGLGENMRAVMQKENAAYTHNFMPNASFTPMAVNAIVCGLSDVDIYPNHQLESYRQVYATALAPQLKKLGYKTQFWYSGFSGWERIEDFALAQGFDEFHCASDYRYPSGNVWGSDDRFIFERLQENAANNSEPTVYVVLSVSNHAPYSVDLARENFPKEELRAKLPSELQNDEEFLNRLGHYWYTDKIFGEFINNMEAKQPQENLFIITGDHADRGNIEKQPSLFDRYTVPFIIYGDGVKKDILSDDIAGGHVNLGATLLELIAPKGFEYYSLGKSLTRGANVGFNDGAWLTPEAMGRIDGTEPQYVKDKIEMYRTISWQRTIRGNTTAIDE
ncbi:LTA synthase family protein [Megamonas hypermegale]|uniref:LTA synthase family protein n=1 Tax=Megamonas hypermegale TaxID=158847 RepID=UPI0026E97CCD|nr:alkaline phosphatase family protein [Megamonas hypermegale]